MPLIIGPNDYLRPRSRFRVERSLLIPLLILASILAEASSVAAAQAGSIGQLQKGWEVTFKGRLQDATFLESRGLVVNFYDSDKGKPHYKLVTSEGRVVTQGEGAIRDVSRGRARILGSFGVQDTPTGEQLSNNPIGKKGTVVVSNLGGDVRAVHPEFLGLVPKRPFLRVFSSDGNQIADLTELVEDLFPGSPLQTGLAFRVIFTDPNNLVIAGGTSSGSLVALIRIDEKKVAWRHDSEDANSVWPTLLFGRARLIVYQRLAKKSRKSPSHWGNLCAYSFSGTMEWCIEDENSLQHFKISESGNYLAALARTGPNDADTSLRVISGDSGETLWEASSVGRPIAVSEEAGNVYTIEIQQSDGGQLFPKTFAELPLDGSAGKQFGFPVLTEGVHHWHTYYVPDSKTLILLTASKVIGFSTAQ